MNILIDSQTLYTPEIQRGIGVYFKELIEALIKSNIEHDFYILVKNEDDIKIFSEFTFSNVIPVYKKEFDFFFADGAEVNQENSVRYSQMIHALISDFSIDIYWSPNALMNNVFLPSKENENVIYLATIYDLIPLVMQDRFLDVWPAHIKDIYLHKLKTLSHYNHLLFISQFTANDYEKNVNHDKKQKNTIITLGVSKHYRPLNFPMANTYNENYILYVGGFDPRKNMPFAVTAFSLFLQKHEDKNVRLKIVCSVNQEEKKKLYELTDKLGITSQVDITGFVNKSELLELYQHSKAFFFPSLYEGFGLPVLEALACGVPVCCSSTSSLPEVGGKHVIYFDPENRQEAAESLLQALNEKNGYNIIKKRVEYAKTFSWDKTAKAFHAVIDEYVRQSNPKNFKRIAWISPFPPNKSGISNYSLDVVNELKKYVEVDLFYDYNEICSELLEAFHCYPLTALPQKQQEYDSIFYNIGNHTLHKNMYKMALKIPGTVILHDWYLQPFMDHSFLRSKDNREKEYFYDIFVNNYGFSKENIVKLTKNGIASELWNYSCTEELVRKSKRIIAHSRWVKRQILKSNKIDVIPHYAKWKKPGEKSIQVFRKKIGLPANSYVFSIMGFINKNKLPNLVIEAMSALREKGYPVTLLLGGEVAEDVENDPYFKRALYQKKWIKKLGYLESEDYYSVLELSDLVINLRSPSMGETSGVLSQAIAARNDIIVINKDQYSEIWLSNIHRVNISYLEKNCFENYLESLIVFISKKEKNTDEWKSKNFENSLKLEFLASKYLLFDKKKNV